MVCIRKPNQITHSPTAFRIIFLVVYDERSPNELVVLCDSPNVFLVLAAIVQMWVLGTIAAYGLRECFISSIDQLDLDVIKVTISKHQ